MLHGLEYGLSIGVCSDRFDLSGCSKELTSLTARVLAAFYPICSK